jgi:hypothetical protein
LGKAEEGMGYFDKALSLNPYYTQAKEMKQQVILGQKEQEQ